MTLNLKNRRVLEIFYKNVHEPIYQSARNASNFEFTKQDDKKNIIKTI
jgi:hypothetical protein